MSRCDGAERGLTGSFECRLSRLIVPYGCSMQPANLLIPDESYRIKIQLGVLGREQNLKERSDSLIIVAFSVPVADSEDQV